MDTKCYACAMQEIGESNEKSKLLAAQLASWDPHISQIAIIQALADEDARLDLVCSFEPEPDCDATGFFLIANLLTRIEFERLDERLTIPFAYELGFKMGEQVFLPNGKILRGPQDYTVLWPEHE